jgi:hypothetical protein
VDVGGRLRDLRHDYGRHWHIYAALRSGRPVYEPSRRPQKPGERPVRYETAAGLRAELEVLERRP